VVERREERSGEDQGRRVEEWQTGIVDGGVQTRIDELGWPRQAKWSHSAETDETTERIGSLDMMGLGRLGNTDN